jgi:hypothetical protein
MRTSRDPDRLIHDFLQEGEDQLFDQVYDTVRAEIEHKRQRAVFGLWRTPVMNKIAGLSLAAAALVAVLLVGYQLLGSPTGTGGPGEPTATPVPTGTSKPTATPVPTGTSVPTATPEPTDAAVLPEGSHVLWDRMYAGKQIIVTIPAPDWYGEPGGGILAKHGDTAAPDGAALIVFVGANQGLQQDLQQYLYVYGHPCHWSTTTPASPVTTVDEAVTALTSQASRDASVPVDVTVGGNAGKSIILHVPDDAVFSDCDQGEFRTLIEAYEFGAVTDAGEGARARYAQDPGQIDKLWVFEMGYGLVIIDATYYEGTPQSVVDELVAIVESARVSRVSSPLD